MAEEVRDRLRTMRLSVAVAVAAVLGGLGYRDATAAAKETGLKLKRNSVTSKHVKDKSLKYRDFRPGQVYSQAQTRGLFIKHDEADATYLKLDDAIRDYYSKSIANETFLKVGEAYSKHDANELFIKHDDAEETFHKIVGESYYKITDADATFIKHDDAEETFHKIVGESYYKITDADETFLKIGDAYGKIDADATFLKLEDAYSKNEIDQSFLKVGDAYTAAEADALFVRAADPQFVRGNGQVITGAQAAPTTEPVRVLTADRLLTATGVRDHELGPYLVLHNISSEPLAWSTDGAGAVLAEDAQVQLPFDSSSDLIVVQLVGLESERVATLTFSAIQTGDWEPGAMFSAQLLIGAVG